MRPGKRGRRSAAPTRVRTPDQLIKELRQTFGNTSRGEKPPSAGDIMASRAEAFQQPLENFQGTAYVSPERQQARQGRRDYKDSFGQMGPGRRTPEMQEWSLEREAAQAEARAAQQAYRDANRLPPQAPVQPQMNQQAPMQPSPQGPNEPQMNMEAPVNTYGAPAGQKATFEEILRSQGITPGVAAARTTRRPR